METLTIELTNPKAITLLQDLEELHLIKLLRTEKIIKPKFSTQLRGSISPEAADKFNQEVRKSRDEWERGI